MPEATAGAASTEAAPKLNDLMLAMDVVDTLRHQEGIVANELGQDDRDEKLKERLRQIYQGQGLEVTDRVLDEGIRALKESRFVYTPPAPSFGRTMANLWIKRGVIGSVLGILCLLIVGFFGWQFWNAQSAQRSSEQAKTEITSVLPKKLSDAVNAARKEAKGAEAQQAVDSIAASGQSAVAAGDAQGMNEAITRLAALRSKLAQEYTLRIVSRPGEKSGIFRIPNVNRGARNYYLVVEPLSPDGKLLSLPVTSEENGKVETVTKWAQRVPKSTYDAVSQDKLNDGIVQQNRVAEKVRGELNPKYLMPVENGAITKW
jgi:hypothetical protein